MATRETQNNSKEKEAMLILYCTCGITESSEMTDASSWVDELRLGMMNGFSGKRTKPTISMG